MLSPELHSAPPNQNFNALLALDTEVDVDIALKQRLADTLEDRIKWALILQESLENGKGHATPETLRGVALEALAAVESSSACILTGDPPAPFNNNPTPSVRPPPRKVVQSKPKSKGSFLYIKATSITDREREGQNHLYLLRCPECSRTSFTSLQGLLNHARLTHSLEWGTHDDCIRACIVPDNDLDVDSGIEVGLGPLGILPGLRSIFQKAVGSGGHNHFEGDVKLGSMSAKNTMGILNQTLGIHEDTPGLAPYLGKNTIRKAINAWDEDQEVDIMSKTQDARGNGGVGRRAWRMPFSQRNFVETLPTESEAEAERPPLPTSKGDGVTASTQPASEISSQSRFHFVARVEISDRSLWIPPEERVDKDDYKWMISVDAPSYARHITTILNSISVSSSDSTITTSVPCTKSEPPFVIVGTSSKPFMARVKLSFTGATGNPDPTLPAPADQVVDLEHWVKLDPLRSQHVVLGDVQVIDIELSRNTKLKPLQFAYTPIGSRSLWNQPTEGSTNASHVQPESRVSKCRAWTPLHSQQKLTTIQDSYEKVLQGLAKRFPMTEKDARGRSTLALPYKIVSGPKYFKTLVAGRRKAIEWGRARAIRDAYNQAMSQPSEFAPLSVADVFSWLSENGYFIQIDNNISKAKRQSSETQDTVSSTYMTTKRIPGWCPACGLDLSRHPLAVDFEEGKQKVENVPQHLPQPDGLSMSHGNPRCPIASEHLPLSMFPMVDIWSPLVNSRGSPSVPPPISLARDETLVVTSADPHMILWTRSVMSDLRYDTLPRYPTLDNGQEPPLYTLDEGCMSREEVDSAMAGPALLALATKYLVRCLVDAAIDVARRDKDVAVKSCAPGKSNKKASDATSPLSMLAPTHIIRGVLNSGGKHYSSALLGCFSRLGLAVDSDIAHSSRHGEPASWVKVEE